MPIAIVYGWLLLLAEPRGKGLGDSGRQIFGPAVEKDLFPSSVCLEKLDETPRLLLSQRVKLELDTQIRQKTPNVDVLLSQARRFIRVCALEDRQKEGLFGLEMSEQLPFKTTPSCLTQSPVAPIEVIAQLPEELVETLMIGK